MNSHGPGKHRSTAPATEWETPAAEEIRVSAEATAYMGV